MQIEPMSQVVFVLVCLFCNLWIYSYVAICLATLCERRIRLRVFVVFINAADGRIIRRRPLTPIAFWGFIFMLFCKHNKQRKENWFLLFRKRSEIPNLDNRHINFHRYHHYRHLRRRTFNAIVDIFE